MTDKKIPEFPRSYVDDGHNRMKYTPGPWIPSKFGYQVLTGDGWNTICLLKDGASWEDGEPGTMEANSRLIAAAPDLLAALKPFGEIAKIILSESPADATEVNLFTDCTGCRHTVTLDGLRVVMNVIAKIESQTS